MYLVKSSSSHLAHGAALISDSMQGRPKSPLAMQNASWKSPAGGDKNKEVRGDKI